MSLSVQTAKCQRSLGVILDLRIQEDQEGGHAAGVVSNEVLCYGKGFLGFTVQHSSMRINLILPSKQD